MERNEPPLVPPSQGDNKELEMKDWQMLSLATLAEGRDLSFEDYIQTLAVSPIFYWKERCLLENGY